MEGNYTDNDNCLGPSIIVGNATQYWLANLQQHCFWEPYLKRGMINMEENSCTGPFFYSCDNVQQKSKYWQCCTLVWFT